MFLEGLMLRGIGFSIVFGVWVLNIVSWFLLDDGFEGDLSSFFICI